MYLKRAWYRLANPARRLAVTLRYEGGAAAIDLFRQRYRPNPADFLPLESTLSLPEATILPARTPPRVSVIVRTRNRPALLEQALISLAHQVFTDFEAVIVNDGEVSVEPVLERLEGYVRLQRTGGGSGRGRTAALNVGLAAARGRWIAYLDDDDIVYPDHLARLMGALGDGIARAAYTDANRALCWSDLQRDQMLLRLGCLSQAFDFDRLVVDNWIPNMAFMHAADCLDTVGVYDERLDLFEDWDFLIRLGRAYPLRHCAHTTCEYRYRFGRLPEESRSALRRRWEVLEATQAIYARYPTASRELNARRRLTLSALRQDIEEVRRIEETVADPIHRDLLITALTGRFPVSPALSHRFPG